MDRKELKKDVPKASPEVAVDEQDLQAAVEFVRVKIKVHIFSPEEKTVLGNTLDAFTRSRDFSQLTPTVASEMYFALKERNVSKEKLRAFLDKLSPDPRAWLALLYECPDTWAFRLIIDRLLILPLSLADLIELSLFTNSAHDRARVRALLESKPFSEWKAIANHPDRRIRRSVYEWWNQDSQKKAFLEQSGLNENIMQVLDGKTPPDDLSSEEKATVCLYAPAGRTEISSDLQASLGKSFSDWKELFVSATQDEARTLAIQNMLDSAVTPQDISDIAMILPGRYTLFLPRLLERLNDIDASFEQWLTVAKNFTSSGIFEPLPALHVGIATVLSRLAKTYDEWASVYDVAPRSTPVSQCAARMLISNASTFTHFFQLLHWLKEPESRSRIMDTLTCIPLDKKQRMELMQYVTNKSDDFISFLVTKLLADDLDFHEAMIVLRNVPETHRARTKIFPIIAKRAQTLSEIYTVLHEIPENTTQHEHVLEKLKTRDDVSFMEWLALCPRQEGRLKKLFVEMLQKTARTFGEKLAILSVLNDKHPLFQELLESTTDSFELMCLYQESRDYPEIRAGILQKLGMPNVEDKKS